MTLLELKQFVGLKTAILSNAGAYVDGMVHEADLVTFINIRRQELFMKFAERYPTHYEQKAYADLEAGIDEYTINGQALDFLDIRYVGLKYSTSDTVYTRARQLDYRLLQPTNTDTTGFATSNPKYEFTMLKELNPVNGLIEERRAILLRPIPTVAVTDGLYLRYVEIPTDMSIDTHSPTDMPTVAHSIIALYAIADVWETKGDWVKSEKAMNRAVYKEKEFFENYQPAASDEPVTVQLTRTYRAGAVRRF